MGVMKRLYTREGKGLPTDGPTVLRGPKPSKASKPAAGERQESGKETAGAADRWAAERAEIAPAAQPGWWKVDGGYFRKQDVMSEKWAAWGLPEHPAEVAAKVKTRPEQLTLF